MFPILRGNHKETIHAAQKTAIETVFKTMEPFTSSRTRGTYVSWCYWIELPIAYLVETVHKDPLLLTFRYSNIFIRHQHYMWWTQLHDEIQRKKWEEGSLLVSYNDSRAVSASHFPSPEVSLHQGFERRPSVLILANTVRQERAGAHPLTGGSVRGLRCSP